MSKYLTQEWLDETGKMADSQPERPGASARMQYVITGGPEGDIKYYWILENGKILESKLGELPDSDFTMTLTYDDSVKVQKGELGSPSPERRRGAVLGGSRVRTGSRPVRSR